MVMLRPELIRKYGLPQLIDGDFQRFSGYFNLNTTFGVTQIHTTKRHLTGTKFDVFTWVLDIDGKLLFPLILRIHCANSKYILTN